MPETKCKSEGLQPGEDCDFPMSCPVHGPAHDAPQVERFDVGYSARMERDATGEYVRYTDYATLEAEKQQLEDENRRLIRHLGAQLPISDGLAERLEAAESSLASLREAVREVVDEGVPMDVGCCFYCASSQPERRHHSGCNWAKLRALVLTPQGEK